MNENDESMAAWASAIIRERVAQLEALRCKTAHHFKGGRRIHKLRTQSRRLRAALEDLRDCLPHCRELLDTCKFIGERTTDARDSIVMIKRLQRYRRFALPAERAEIRKIYDELWEKNAKGLKKARHAVKHRTLEHPQ